MDGDKYNVDIITKITVLSWTRSNQELDLKKNICVLVNGQSANRDKELRWNRSYDPSKLDLVMKPQCFHSAASTFLLLKYPKLRKSDSFIKVVIASKLEDACLKIASDVLNDDVDGVSFLNNEERIFGDEAYDFIIIDDRSL